MLRILTSSKALNVVPGYAGGFCDNRLVFDQLSFTDGVRLEPFNSKTSRRSLSENRTVRTVSRLSSPFKFSAFAAASRAGSNSFTNASAFAEFHAMSSSFSHSLSALRSPAGSGAAPKTLVLIAIRI